MGISTPPAASIRRWIDFTRFDAPDGVESADCCLFSIEHTCLAAWTRKRAFILSLRFRMVQLSTATCINQRFHVNR